jgi:hypothetical protein
MAATFADFVSMIPSNFAGMTGAAFLAKPKLEIETSKNSHHRHDDR